jgi:hypothetical protein
MKTKAFLITVVAALTGAVATAQDKVEATVAADFVNNYIWRGQDLGNVSLQPTLGLSYKGVSLTAWGSVGLAEANDTKEFDLTVAYSFAGFNVGVTDYWFNVGQDPDNRYFLYDAHRTNHVFEANLGYDFGVVNVQAYTNFIGNDGVKSNGDRAYSTYVEVSAPFTFATCDWTATAGFVPMRTTSYGTSGFAVTNLNVKCEKEIPVTEKFSIPVFGQVVANPCAQKAYLVFGFSLKGKLL